MWNQEKKRVLSLDWSRCWPHTRELDSWPPPISLCTIRPRALGFFFTKKGKKGKKITINVSGFFPFFSPSPLPAKLPLSLRLIYWMCLLSPHYQAEPGQCKCVISMCVSHETVCFVGVTFKRSCGNVAFFLSFFFVKISPFFLFSLYTKIFQLHFNYNFFFACSLSLFLLDLFVHSDHVLYTYYIY